MATKYLDSYGLAYLWGKLKNYFQPKLVSGTNIKTVNNNSLLGSGNITISGGDSGTATPTANRVSKFDASAQMNSTDMSNSEVQNFVDGLIASGGTAFLDMVHPVGSYYETSDSMFDPNVSWGGTWELETEGQVHIGAGTNYTIDGALTNTTDGGEKTHTLTAAQTYRLHEIRNTASLSVHSFSSVTSANKYKIPASTSNFTKITDSPSPHNNMQPYIVVNRWHRTA